MDRASRQPAAEEPEMRASEGVDPDRIPGDAERTIEREAERGVERADHNLEDNTNPPRTTTGRMTAPKFGSAVSGGGDIEPAPGT